MKRVLSSLFFILCISFFANSQIINTVAGDSNHGYNGDGIAATTAELYNPTGLAIDLANNFYVADTKNNRIRVVNASSGLIYTIAGNGIAGFKGDGMPVDSAELYWPWDVFVDKVGNVYIADTYNWRVRMIDTSGIINTVAGDSTGGYYNGDSVPATAANLYNPTYVIKDKIGNLYISDCDNERIRMVNTNGIIYTIAGSYQWGAYGGDGGPATAAYLNQPNAIAFDTSGNLYFTDTYNNIVRKVDKVTGIITTVAGNYNYGGGFSGDGGPATAARLYWPSGLAFDSANNMYIAGGRLIRKVSGSTGLISTIAGDSNYFNCSGDGGPATAATMDPWGIALTKTGYILSDQGNSRVREVATPNVLTSLKQEQSNYLTSIFPNPSNGIFTLSVSNIKANCNVEVFNIFGEKVFYQLKIDKGQFTINLGEQPQGIYLYRVQKEDGTQVGEGKVVIQK